MMVSRVVQTTFLLAQIAVLFAADASRNRITVTKFKTNYRIDSWDDNREDPYRVTFWKYGLKSVYTFDTSGNIKTLTTARNTLYSFDDEVGSQMLAGTNDDSVEDVDVAEASRFSCPDCSRTWSTLCDKGLADVCYLDDNPQSIFDEDAEDSVRRFCSAVGAACETSAYDICDGQCTSTNKVMFL